MAIFNGMLTRSAHSTLIAGPMAPTHMLTQGSPQTELGLTCLLVWHQFQTHLPIQWWHGTWLVFFYLTTIHLCKGAWSIMVTIRLMQYENHSSLFVQRGSTVGCRRIVNKSPQSDWFEHKWHYWAPISILLKMPTTNGQRKCQST